MKLRALIVDDEELARDKLRTLLSRHRFVNIVGEAANGAAGIALARELRPDVIFLDIEMPKRGGMEVMRELPDGVKIVFVTAHAQHAVPAFEGGAGDYLLKPFSASRLELALERVRTRIRQERSAALIREEVPALRIDVGRESGDVSREGRLVLKVNDRFAVVSIGDITHVTTERNYLCINVAAHCYLVRGTLTAFLEIVAGLRFERLGRSAAINTEQVRAIGRIEEDSMLFEFKDGVKFRTSRSRCRALLAKFNVIGGSMVGKRRRPG